MVFGGGFLQLVADKDFKGVQSKISADPTMQARIDEINRQIEKDKSSVWSRVKANAKTATKVFTDPAEAARRAQSNMSRVTTALHTAALSDIMSMSGDNGLFKNPSGYVRQVASGIKTDLKDGGRVMGDFFSGKWSALAAEGAYDLGTVAGASAKQKAGYAKVGGEAGKVYETVDRGYNAYQTGGYAALAGEGAKAAGVDPAIVNAAVQAKGAIDEGRLDLGGGLSAGAISSYAVNVPGKATDAAQRSVSPQGLGDGGAWTGGTPLEGMGPSAPAPVQTRPMQASERAMDNAGQTAASGGGNEYATPPASQPSGLWAWLFGE